MTESDGARPSPRRRAGILAVAATAVVVAVIAAAVIALRPSGTASDDVVTVASAVGAEQRLRLLVPQEGTLLGSWTAPNKKGAPPPVWTELWDEREALVGRPLDIGHDFHPFEEPFPTPIERDHIDEGRIPMISWNGTDADEIVAGDHDDLILERAKALRDLGVPVLLRFWWEMDTQPKQAWVDRPADFVDAWRHVHHLFDSAGVTNVAWVWCPTSVAFTKGTADEWWPGDGWVDWICADGYNFAPAKPNDPWRPFADIFDPFYEWATAKDKPIMIGEFGVLEREPGEKAAWLRQATVDLRERFPDIRAVVYFDSRREVDGRQRDWRIDTSPEATEAFAELASSLDETVVRRR